FALSKNGERLVFTTLERAPWIARLYAVELDNPGVVTLIKEDEGDVPENFSFPPLAPAWLALSDDGQTIAARLKNTAADDPYDILAVMRFDGSDITTVA